LADAIMFSVMIGHWASGGCKLFSKFSGTKQQTCELDCYATGNLNVKTSHSAEYITAGLELSSACSAASYIIIPVVPSNSYIDENDVLETQTQELSSLLNAHGINAKIADAEYQQDFNSLSANGRTAKLKITFSESVNS